MAKQAVVLSVVGAVVIVLGGLIAADFALSNCTIVENILGMCADVETTILVTGSGFGSLVSRDSEVTAAGTSNATSLHEFRALILDIKFCRKIAVTEYQHNSDEVGYDREPVEKTCVTLEFNKGPESDDICEQLEEYPDRMVDFTDPSAVHDAYSVQTRLRIRDLPDFRYVQVRYLRRFGVRATMRLDDNASGSQLLYTKKCGPATCGSTCDGLADNIRDCRGLTDGPGSTAGDVNSLGDIWTPSAYDSGIGDGSHYWRRCSHRMDQGPAELVWTEPESNQAILFALTPPEKSNFNSLTLAFNPDNVLASLMKPMIDNSGEFQHTNYYGVTDGVYAIVPNSFSMIGMLHNSADDIVVETWLLPITAATAQPVCYLDGFDQPATVGYSSGACHPAHGWEFDYSHDGVVSNDREFDTTGMSVSQDVTLRVEIYYRDGAPDNVIATDVAKYYPSGVDVQTQLPFFSMLVEKIEQQSDDTYWIYEARGPGLFPRIRHLDRTGGSVAHVMLDDQEISNNNAACGSCGYDCEDYMCYSSPLMMTVQPVLKDVRKYTV